MAADPPAPAPAAPPASGMGHVAATGLRERLAQGKKLVLPATATFSLSYLLQQLSGHALWVPDPLRVAVEVFTTLFGTLVYLFVDARSRRVRVERAHAVPTAEVARQTRRRDVGKALACSAGAVLLFLSYMELRARCVISWDARDWLDVNGADVAKDEARGGVDNAAPREFVDLEHGQVYVPLIFPEPMQVYFDRVETANHVESGLQWVLQKEPDRLIDWLREGEARRNLSATSALFLLNHLLIIACVAAAAAYAGAKRQSEPHASEPASPSTT